MGDCKTEPNSSSF